MINLGVATKRKVCPRGNRGATNSIAIPANLQVGKFVTIAASRLMLVDPLGKVAPEDLLEYLESYVEPNFWVWLKKKERSISDD